MGDGLKNLSVTLVEPEYPINVGYVARLLKNFGIPKLYVIDPKVDLRIASVYASHASELIEGARVVSFKELRETHDLLAATTAVRASRRANVVRTVSSLEHVAKYIKAAESASLILGRDTTGLTNKELALCDVVTTIDTGTPHRTLNVSHAAAIILYIISRERSQRKSLQSTNARQMFGRYSYELAIASGLQAHRAQKLREVLGRIALKSGLDDRELSLLVGLNRKALLTIRRRKS